MDITKLEKDVSEYWKTVGEKDANGNPIGAFKQSLKLSENKPHFVFYDGPPFATGLPHYGHIVGSTLKDIVPRYKTQTGYYVPRKWGFDTHGLPIEFEIEKKLGIKTKQQVLDYGIANYNEECRKIVMKYSKEWKTTIDRIGRWVDMDNDYKTMDPAYMQSVWWVFKELFNKGLVYRGFKVMPYSMGCATPLSNFEANDNYKDTLDYSIVVRFLVQDSESRFGHKNVSFLVWTTTPWTLPSNLMLCVNESLQYVLVNVVTENKHTGDEITNEYAILQKDCCETILQGKKFTILSEFMGNELIGVSYVPMYKYFEKFRDRGAFKVCADKFVKVDSGTGIVHCAPGFGVDDHRVCQELDIITKTNSDYSAPVPLDANGCFVDPVHKYLGKNVKDCEDDIVQSLKERGLLFTKNKEKHPYPYCWRSDTPLIYRTCDCWFINVEKIRDSVIKNNKETTWVPSHIRDNRFGKWLEGAVDWCVSRNRFWGTPIPLWVSDDGEEVVCIGSVEELETLAQLPSGSVKDLHRHNVDHITIPSKKHKGNLKRVDTVLDCWFESGSMPYGQHGYPFNGDNKGDFQFADFIAEGLDQTRGWFYTLMVLSTALFDKPAFKNVIVNGIVLNEKGEKMSKRKRNYPEPTKVLDEFGADALRLYLISTPVVHAQDLKFKKDDIRDIVRKYHYMIRNVVKFYEEMIGFHDNLSTKKFKLFDLSDYLPLQNLDVLDHWILACVNDLYENIRKDMDKYRLTRISYHLFKFIDQLSRWYVNLNKHRFKDMKTTETCLLILGNCLYHFSVIVAPFTPFIAEWLYTKLKPQFATAKNAGFPKFDSVHFIQIPAKPVCGQDETSKLLLGDMDMFQTIVDVVRAVRTKRLVPSTKMPLRKITVVSQLSTRLESLKGHLKDELNVFDIEYTDDEERFIEYSVQLDIHKIKPTLTNPRIIGQLLKEIKKLPKGKVHSIVSNKKDILFATEIGLPKVEYQYLIVKKNNKENVPGVPHNTKIVARNNIVVIVDDAIDDQLIEEYQARCFIRNYQESRKEAGLQITDKIDLEIACTGKDATKYLEMLEKYRDFIMERIGLFPSINSKIIHTKSVKIGVNTDVRYSGKNDSNMDCKIEYILKRK